MSVNRLGNGTSGGSEIGEVIVDSNDLGNAVDKQDRGKVVIEMIKRLIYTRGIKLDLIVLEHPNNPLLECNVSIPALYWKVCYPSGCHLLVDDTIGSFYNVDILGSIFNRSGCITLKDQDQNQDQNQNQYGGSSEGNDDGEDGADKIYQNISVVSSLTKWFSGKSNVMGGSVVTKNKQIRTYFQDCTITSGIGRDRMIFPQDCTILEYNSRDFIERMQRVNRNGQYVYKRLADYNKYITNGNNGGSGDVDGGKTSGLIKQVYYPVNNEYYNETIRKTSTSESESECTNGYTASKNGGLISVEFYNECDAITFYNKLKCNKGPSLGTNFTLVSAYTILAHYNELEFVNTECGVSRWLIRISVGLEEFDELDDIF
ncbi:putative cystathionine gamma-synthase [Zancudomyces culisetae]|uniref:Putative cystathionine gamma-synthase n=1 Tax=Zancudomyces culisetae TaxID=1213189 RepID=A0A1R1PJJ1_ZANCU|nr:putative cystathionine gamma-synthase [Zancudomyces culisetae]|eukprot:OMH81042.1 putative cystathionine gamma-synthase [Zancudomyces culisetae]